MAVCLEIDARALSCVLFFFNDPATTEIYTLSLHDALPIYAREDAAVIRCEHEHRAHVLDDQRADRKSTRLNSSHQIISYAVFCLKKKNVTLHARVVSSCNHLLSELPAARFHREDLIL